VRYTIEQDGNKRESFAPYWYRIYRDGSIFAHYWHDYRGDDHGIKFVDGQKTGWPFGRMTDFLQGGGPKPLLLSARAIAYLERS
jgi:hypothetical protein